MMTPIYGPGLPTSGVLRCALRMLAERETGEMLPGLLRRNLSKKVYNMN